MKSFFTTLAFLLSMLSLVAAHGAIIKAVGNRGGSGSALGIIPDTPRNGTTPNPFQRDTTILSKGLTAKGCGRTNAGGANNITNGTNVILNKNGGLLPQVSANGTIAMTLHQVNGDGAGPYVCQLNTDGTANSWTMLQVTTQVPGNKGRSNAAHTDFPLVAALPINLQCNGTVSGQNSVCIVRCGNPVGPFGGCVPVQIAGPGSIMVPAPSKTISRTTLSVATATKGTASVVATVPAAGVQLGRKRSLTTTQYFA